MTNPTPPGQVPEALQPDTALLVARNCRETGSDPSCPFFARVQLMDAAYVLERLHAENVTLQQGYDAARLEIEALRMREGMHRMSTPDGSCLESTMSYALHQKITGTWDDKHYPELPKSAGLVTTQEPITVGGWVKHLEEPGFTEDQLRAYADATCAMRAQAAPAISAGDAVFAFASMLTALPHVIPFGAAAWATPGVELATAFNAANGFSVSQNFPDGLVFPKITGDLLAVVETAAAPVAQGDAEDAERYRWLRDGCDTKGSAASRIASDCYGLEWDKLIDAARAQAKEGANND